MIDNDFETRLDRPYGQQAETRAAAAARVSREPDAQLLLEALGLVDDPATAGKSRAKALAALTGKQHTVGRETCQLCGNWLPKHGVCRRGKRCREAAREREETT